MWHIIFAVLMGLACPKGKDNGHLSNNNGTTVTTNSDDGGVNPGGDTGQTRPPRPGQN